MQNKSASGDGFHAFSSEMGNFWTELCHVTVTEDGSLQVPCLEPPSDVTGLAV